MGGYGCGCTEQGPMTALEGSAFPTAARPGVMPRYSGIAGSSPVRRAIFGAVPHRSAQSLSLNVLSAGEAREPSPVRAPIGDAYAAARKTMDATVI